MDMSQDRFAGIFNMLAHGSFCRIRVARQNRIYDFDMLKGPRLKARRDFALIENAGLKFQSLDQFRQQFGSGGFGDMHMQIKIEISVRDSVRAFICNEFLNRRLEVQPIFRG